MSNDYTVTRLKSKEYSPLLMNTFVLFEIFDLVPSPKETEPEKEEEKKDEEKPTEDARPEPDTRTDQEEAVQGIQLCKIIRGKCIQCLGL